MRNQFKITSTDIAEKDEKSCMLIGDISHHLLREYEEKFPDRFYNLGICEQTLIGLASGMAMEGYRPIVHTIAPFCVERAYEQIKIDLCYQNVDVTIISVGSSFDYSHLGCTHHCYEDVSILRSLPNIQVFVPGSSEEFNALLQKTWANGSPKYFKLSNKEHKQNFKVEPFKHNIVREGKGKKVAIVNGHLLEETLKAAKEDLTVIYLASLNHLEESSKIEISNIIDKADNVYLIEENSRIGGLGDLIFDICTEYNKAIKAKKIAIPNKFLTNYGKPEEHREAIGLTAESIEKAIYNV